MLTLNLNYVKIINPYYKDINNLIGTEAQLVNEEIDARVVEFQDFWDLDTADVGDPVDVRDEILKEIMSERKDRLGLHRTINTNTTVWSQRFNIDRSEFVSENLAEEPPYPFGPAQPGNPGKPSITNGLAPFGPVRTVPDAREALQLLTLTPPGR